MNRSNQCSKLSTGRRMMSLQSSADAVLSSNRQPGRRQSVGRQQPALQRQRNKVIGWICGNSGRRQSIVSDLLAPLLKLQLFLFQTIPPSLQYHPRSTSQEEQASEHLLPPTVTHRRSYRAVLFGASVRIRFCLLVCLGARQI